MPDKQALFWKPLKNKILQCQLCPHFCTIAPDGVGKCGVRQNQKGKLYSLVYGKAASIAVDPVEKKPLFHFLPGSAAFSFGTVGCNLKCEHCQNWTTSQATPAKWHSYDIEPKEIVKKAIEEHCESIAYTYNEPTIFIEYALETAKLARKKGLKNITVTNGFINPEPLRELCKYLDGSNVDIKSFDDEFYKKHTSARLAPVLECLKILKEEGVWFEMTNLLIPSLNDNPAKIKKMVVWIKNNLGTDYPLHFTAFFPAFKKTDLPPTSSAKLLKAREIALKAGLKYVYVGNVLSAKEENTYCPNPKCRKLLIEREYFNILQNNLKDGRCPECNTKIAGVWS